MACRYDVCLEEYTDLLPRSLSGTTFKAIGWFDFFASLAKRFHIQIPHGFHNGIICFQNKTKYGPVGIKGLTT